MRKSKQTVEELKLFYSLSSEASFFNSKSTSRFTLPGQHPPTSSLNFVFRERASFPLSTGLEVFTLKVYSRADEDDRLEEEFQVRVGEELVGLIDQREHVKVLTGKQIAVKVVIKWQYDGGERDRIADLQGKQIEIEK
jgi:hypothetical protein